MAFGSKNRAQLEKEIPKWSAAFENASKVYQSTSKNLDIQVAPEYLEELINKIPDDKTSQFKSWVQQFAEVCKELGKYQQKLEEEYKERWDTCNNNGLDLEAKETELQSNQAALEDKIKELNKQTEELEQLRKQLTGQQNELTSREREIHLREVNAEQGFEKENREALKRLKSEQGKERESFQSDISKLRQQEDELARAIEAAKVTLNETEQQRQKEFDKKELDLQNRMFELDGRESGVKKEQGRLKLEKQALEEEKNFYKSELDLKNQVAQQRIEQKRQESETNFNIERQHLEAEWDDLLEAKGNLDTLVTDAMKHERQAHQSELDRLNQKLDVAWSKVDDLKTQLEDYKELESSLGDRSVNEIFEQIERLKKENRDLQRKRSESDADAFEKQNETLRSHVNHLEKELNELRPELEQARTEATHKRIAAAQLQAIQQEKRILEQHKIAMSVHIDDLESRIAQLTNANKAQTPFPAMSNMDSDKNFQATMELETVPDLSDFAEELRHRIAQAERIKLYYPLEDIRVLLGGLAMSQLHVFQGISGTGKTSLAKAFAKAMGGFCTDIAVQAGWRDRDDLLGHYNAFERRFYEKDCLQALYQAQTPRWSDTCNVILLDELNLSRPEQYFSEFLSALERNDHTERLISLSETALPNAPSKLKNGRQVLVPRNIWFIGTANHDETTNELADKTYDRSLMMTLPKQDERFTIHKYEATSYSYSSLQKAFQQATDKHLAKVQELVGELADHAITNELANTFALGWGNRFERQAKRFIPVMLACGATEGEALDHLLSTRIMRNGKVTGRYDVTADDIGNLTNALENFWSARKLNGDPIKSLELLDADRQRKERGA